MNINSLYIVSTPIGHLADMTLRAIETLKSVDCIACEDTRHSRPLLQHYGIDKPLIAFHEHNEREQVETLIKRIERGESIAYISDAGTPLISDPGFHLVQLAKERGIKVVPIPGVSALITALSVSGLATDRFTFEGFLPAKSAARLTRLRALINEPRTLIFYEAPHRILDLLNALQQVFGEERKIVLARELTKLFETILSGKISEIIARVNQDPNQERGEMVVLVAGNANPISSEWVSADIILNLLLKEMSVKKAAEITAKITGKRKNELYQRALNL